jgi:hypothetical protein
MTKKIETVKPTKQALLSVELYRVTDILKGDLHAAEVRYCEACQAAREKATAAFNKLV